MSRPSNELAARLIGETHRLLQDKKEKRDDDELRKELYEAASAESRPPSNVHLANTACLEAAQYVIRLFSSPFPPSSANTSLSPSSPFPFRTESIKWCVHSTTAGGKVHQRATQSGALILFPFLWRSQTVEYCGQPLTKSLNLMSSSVSFS